MPENLYLKIRKQDWIEGDGGCFRRSPKDPSAGSVPAALHRPVLQPNLGIIQLTFFHSD